MPLDPSRTVAELRELQQLTGDENGAEETIDAAGNQWFTLRGASDRAVLIGGHIDSVPNGGWLDGALNVMAGVEVVRRIAEEGTPPVTVRLVNWADEEGARFGRSLFGSSAAAGSMVDQDELRQLTDREGIALPDALAEHGVDLDRALEARSQLESAATYLELHIEQGPVLEALEIREIAARTGDGAVCTSGDVVCRPGIVTSVVETAKQLLDQRHLDAAKLASMLEQAKESSGRFAQ